MKGIRKSMSEDLISRQAAIDAIKREGCANCDSYNGVRCRVCQYQNCMDIIEELPSAQQWIPCSERLPDKDGRYLTTNSRIGEWIVDWNIWHNEPKPSWLYNQGVIAWMPLPEPYEEEEE